MNDNLRTASSLPDSSQEGPEIQILFFVGPLSFMLLIGSQQFEWNIGVGDIDEYNEKFVKILQELSNHVAHKGIDLTNDSHQYFDRLRQVGTGSYNRILGNKVGHHIAQLEATAHNFGLTFMMPPQIPTFFWEMLYSGNSDETEPEQFWGFRYPIGYIRVGSPDLHSISIQKGFFAAIHNGLKLSMHELEQIGSLIKNISQYLEDELRLQRLDHLSPHMFSARGIIDYFQSDKFCYGIVHLACHCEDPPDEGATRSYLSLTACQQELNIYLEDLINFQEKGFHGSPFVFVNACNSATHNHPFQAIKLPTEMVNFGAGGIIATCCDIADVFASAFAVKFYEYLLDDIKSRKYVNISKILLKTRRYFLDTYNNPLGLAYGLYARSSQRLKLSD